MIRARMDAGDSLPDGMPWIPDESLEDFTRRTARYKSHLSLPLMERERLDRMLRYETTIHRQMAYAINQLERLQRARKGEHVPPPVTVHLSTDQ